jgi:hypothetical protein
VTRQVRLRVDDVFPGQLDPATESDVALSDITFWGEPPPRNGAAQREPPSRAAAPGEPPGVPGDRRPVEEPARTRIPRASRPRRPSTRALTPTP